MRELIEFGTARLTRDPGAAEDALRRAVASGGAVLADDQIARLRSMIVTAVSGQPGHDTELVAAALAAAASWEHLSVADCAHHTLLAARIHRRAGRHREAAELYGRALRHRELPYPPPEAAILHEQFGQSLQALHRYRDAAREFAIGARLVANDPGCRELHADLLSSVAAAENSARPAAVLRRALRASVRQLRRPGTSRLP